jgi:hypothetical protein
MKNAVEHDTRKWVMLQQLRRRVTRIKRLRGGHPIYPRLETLFLPEGDSRLPGAILCQNGSQCCRRGMS